MIAFSERICFKARHIDKRLRILYQSACDARWWRRQANGATLRASCRRRRCTSSSSYGRQFAAPEQGAPSSSRRKIMVLSKIFGSFKRRRTSSEGVPITLSAVVAGGRDSTSSCGSVDWDKTTSPAGTLAVAAAQGAEPLAPIKRVIVVVDHSNEARHALVWALSHAVHKLDVLTLLYVSSSSSRPSAASNSQESSSDRVKLRREAKCQQLTDALRSLCLERVPEIEVEVLVVEGDKGPTIVGQAQKLDASLLVLGQRRLGLLWRLLRMKRDGLIDYCIQNANCLTLAVRQNSRRVGGYLINSKWQKNFWLLA